MVGDIDSPLNGVSLEQLEDYSGLPVNGWQDPSTEERFILRVDEGVGLILLLPAVPHNMLMKPCGLIPNRIPNSHYQSQQEVYLIDLELF